MPMALYEPISSYADNTNDGINVTLNERLRYLVVHQGRRGTSAGVTDDVMIGFNAAYGTTDYTTGTKKHTLTHLKEVVIGPGIASINLRTPTAGAEVDVGIVPLWPECW